MGLPQRDTEFHTYADYLSWPDDCRYELIDGIAYAMGPAPTRKHQITVLEIARQIADALDGTPCRPYIAPFDIRLPKLKGKASSKTDTVVQPDISVICDRNKVDDKGGKGAPDWIIEVLSPATASHDQITKRDLYEKVGVREYWLVHPTDRLVTIYHLIDGAYGKPDIRELAGQTPCRVLPEVVIGWEKVLGDED
jgi:Uma2 family endonuclease